MSPVDWGAHEGSDIEQAIAVLLLQDGVGWHRRPGQGDHGVDVAKPIDGGRAYAVYQIKKFTQPLADGSRKRQIRDSYERVLADPHLPGPVEQWTLVLPKNLTDGEEEWFNDLVSSAPFECSWMGITNIEVLVTQHPEVTDYYFDGGKGRLQRTARDLANASEMLRSAADGIPLGAAELLQPIDALVAAVNRDDPFYKYYFEATPNMPDHDVEAGGADPRWLMTQATPLAGNAGWLVVRTYEKFVGARSLNPITGTFTFNFPLGDARAEAARAELDLALRYGIPAAVPNEFAEQFEIAAPGGQDAAGNDFELMLAAPPAENFQPFALLFSVVDENGNELARTRVDATEVRHGATGMAFTLVEAAGTFSVIMFADDLNQVPIEEAVLALTRWQPTLTGKAATAALDGVTLQHFLRPPNTLRLSKYFGAEPPFAGYPIEPGPLLVDPSVVRLTEALASLQPHANAELHIPEAMEPDLFSRTVQAAALLSGEPSHGIWSASAIDVAGDRLEYLLRAEEPQTTLFHVQDALLTLPEAVIEVGSYTMVLESAGLADVERVRAIIEEQPRPAVVAVELTPGVTDSMVAYPQEPQDVAAALGIDHGEWTVI